MRDRENVEKGEYLKLISLIRKKTVRGLNAQEISDFLEEDESYIAKIISFINDNPEMKDEDIYLLILQDKYSLQ